MNPAFSRGALRAVGIAIAVAAAVDPALTSLSAVKPVVIVLALDSARDGQLGDRVAKDVNKQFTVLRSPVADASALVVVGDRLPPLTDLYPAAIFAVLPDSTAPRVSIERLNVPASAPSDGRVPVVPTIAVHVARGRTLDVTLRSGAAIVARASRKLGVDDTTFAVPLAFVPTSVAPAAIRVTATLDGAPAAVADAVVDVRQSRWPVLFYDPRPSWTSTFVRRAIERDPRFVVTSRTVTSRAVSTDAGHPPARLDDIAALSPFDAVIVGAPEALSSAEVMGLETFMRRRGGSVVLLLDQRAPGPYDQLTGVANWSTRSTVVTLAGSDSVSLRTTEAVWPTVLPAGATAIVGGAQPVVWHSAVGAGRLVVSGALDAWRFRDSSTSGFDRFWRTAIAGAAAAAPAAVAVEIVTPVVRPGARVEVRANVRDAALQPAFTRASDGRVVRASLAATLRRAGSRAVGETQSVRLWPDAAPGEFTGEIRAPRDTGVYLVAVAAETNATATAPLVVAADARAAEPTSRRLLDLWASSNGGRAIRASSLSDLRGALTDVTPPARIETWHPMRIAWWMLPFVLCLSAEWWLRRRAGPR